MNQKLEILPSIEMDIFWYYMKFKYTIWHDLFKITFRMTCFEACFNLATEIMLLYLFVKFDIYFYICRASVFIFANVNRQVV